MLSIERPETRAKAKHREKAGPQLSVRAVVILSFLNLILEWNRPRKHLGCDHK